MCDRGVVLIRADELITDRAGLSKPAEPFLLAFDESGDVRDWVLPWSTSQSYFCEGDKSFTWPAVNLHRPPFAAPKVPVHHRTDNEFL